MKKPFLITRKEISKWMKRAAIVSAVLFIISLVGFIFAYNMPTEIEEKTTLLSYKHHGRFDYLVYLKPSHLFGPEPKEPPPPPPNPKYIVALIDSIDMSFTYETDSELLQGVEITAILENPGIWQKEIELVPVTGKEGSFKVYFELDLDDINWLFNVIDGETGIRSSTRLITIVARVGLGEGLVSESLKQSLPMELSSSILEVNSDLTKTQSGAKGTFDYTIHLEENSLYDTETLKPPEVTPYIPPETKTMGEGTVIPYALADKIDITYYYDFSSNPPVEDLTSEVKITATLENPDVWSKTFTLVPSTKKSGDFKIGFPVDVDYFNRLLDTIREETDISAEAHNLIIKANVYTRAETDFGPIDETFSQTLSCNVEKGTLQWNEKLSRSQGGAITTTEVIPNPNRYLGLSVDKLRLVSIILSCIFILLFIASVVMYNRFKPAEPSMIEKEALQAGKKYGDRIAEASSQTPIEGEKIISLGSMEDLVKVADELGKPVIHQPPSASEKRHTYYVIDGTTQYQYIITTRSKERRSHARKSEWF